MFIYQPCRYNCIRYKCNGNLRLRLYNEEIERGRHSLSLTKNRFPLHKSVQMATQKEIFDSRELKYEIKH